MRRLSELISGWDRPTHPSIGQMIQFARRDSVYMARKKLAGLKDWALGWKLFLSLLHKNLILKI